MLVVRKCVTACTFSVEQIDMTVFHTDDKVHIKQRLTIFIVGTVFYGIMLFAIVTIYRAQNEAYMCRSAKNAVIGLCFSVLSAT